LRSAAPFFLLEAPPRSCGANRSALSTSAVREENVFRKLFQILVGLLGWLTFGLLWWVAFWRLPPFREVLTDLVLIVAYATIVALAAYAWVTWRVLLWTRRGREPDRLPCAYDYSRDATGRAVLAEFNTLNSSRYVVVDVVEGLTGPVKTYAAGEETVTDEEARACTG
jgi:hypothetical protein